MTSPTSRRPAVPGALLVPLSFAAVKLAIELSVITRYGWFRDELYYVACSKHLAWGYVDHPPLSIAVLALGRALLGGSLIAVRLLPALTGAATMVVTGLLVRALGGGRFAQALACLCVLLTPVYLLIDHLFSMNTFDQLFWALSALLLVRALATGSPGTWIALGAVLGLGLLNKASVLWLGGALGLGLVLTRHRRVLLTPWPWAAGALALVMLVPNLLWQIGHDWPTAEFVRNATQNKMVRTGVLSFWAQQILVMSPVTLPVWAAGLGWLLASRAWRILGLMYLTVAAILIASGSSRPNYLTVAYPILLAAGGVAFERLGAVPGRRWIRPTVLVSIALAGLPIVPLGLPVLPPRTLAAYLDATGLRPRSQERTNEGPLPQHYADMFGWDDLTARVARVYNGLPLEERSRCAIFTENYGEAAAIDVLGRSYGLPPAISGHNNYWLWGPGEYTGELMIVIGGSSDDPHSDFQSVVLADRTSCEYCMPYENGAPIFLCRGLNMPLDQRWPGVKGYR